MNCKWIQRTNIESYQRCVWTGEQIIRRIVIVCANGLIKLHINYFQLPDKDAKN